MFRYLPQDRIAQTLEIVNEHNIQPDDLLVKLDPGVAASAPRLPTPAATHVATIHRFNGIEFLDDNRVPLLLWLAALNCTLRTAKSHHFETTVAISREVFLRMPLASQRVHLDIRDLLFPPVIPGPDAPRGSTRPEGLGAITPALSAPLTCKDAPPSRLPESACTSSRSPSTRPDATCIDAAPLASDPHVASPSTPPSVVVVVGPGPGTVRSPVSAPPLVDDVPLHAPNIFTLATAGAAGGGATMIQMVYLPVVHTTAMTEAHCFLTVIAGIPIGALGAVVLWSVSEEFARVRTREQGRQIGYLLISLGALIGGGAISLLAHALADMAFKPGPSQEWLSLGLSGAAGSLCAAWSRSMARPTTVWRAIWTAGAAVLGTYLGYFMYLPIVGLLGGVGYDTAPLLALLRQSSMVAVGAFVFVVVTQIMMSLQLHGADAFGLRSAALRAKPMLALVPRSVFPATVLGALVAAVAVLGHSCSFAMQSAQIP